MAGLAAREAALRGVRKALGSSASTNRAQCNKRAGASASGVRACIADGFSGRACSRRAAARVHAASADAAASFDLPESWTAPPVGFNVYETMCIYNPEVPDAERDAEIDALKDFLIELGALDVAVSYENVPQRMAYPIEGYSVGVYVLFMYSAPAQCAKAIQQKLAAPSIEKEKCLLRFMTTRA